MSIRVEELKVSFRTIRRVAALASVVSFVLAASGCGSPGSFYGKSHCDPSRSIGLSVESETDLAWEKDCTLEVRGADAQSVHYAIIRTATTTRCDPIDGPPVTSCSLSSTSFEAGWEGADFEGFKASLHLADESAWSWSVTCGGSSLPIAGEDDRGTCRFIPG